MKFQALVFEENDVRYLGYRMNLRARKFALMRALERSGGFTSVQRNSAPLAALPPGASGGRFRHPSERSTAALLKSAIGS